MAIKDCQEIVLTGGEPTIRPDILELVRYAKKTGFKTIQIQSNGRLFAYKSFCKDIIEAGATEFSPALHGHIAALHDYLTGAEGSFNQVVSGIKNLKSLGQLVITNTVITKSNYRHLPQIAELLVSLGVDQYQFAFVHALGSAGENLSSVVPRMELIEPYVKKGLDVGIKAGKRVMTEAIPYCFMRGYEDFVAEKIIPDSKIYDYNKVISDFTSSRRNEGKSKGPQCRSCGKNEICEGPWKEYPAKFGWEEFRPFKCDAPRKRLHITTSLSCNNNCLFCMEERRADLIKEASKGLEKNIKRNLTAKNRKSESVLFTSGEPTLNKKLVEYIKLAKRSGFKRVSIITNGKKLSDPAFCEELLGAGLDEIGVSLHGSDEKIHDRITGVPGSFDQTLAGLKNLSSLKKGHQFELSVHFTVNKLNCGDMLNFIKLILRTKNVDRLILNAVRPSGKAKINFDKIVPDYSVLAKKFKEAIKEAEKIPAFGKEIVFTINDLPACILPGFQRYLGRSEGIVLKNYHFKKKDEKMNEGWPEKIKRKECAECIFGRHCLGVYPAYIEKRGWSEFIPVKKRNEK